MKKKKGKIYIEPLGGTITLEIDSPHILGSLFVTIWEMQFGSEGERSGSFWLSCKFVRFVKILARIV